jgi:heptosyltransferase-1
VEDRWVLLAQDILDQYGTQVIMLGGPGDAEAGSRIHSANNKIINLVGKSTLTQTASVIKHSSLLVGVDTGLTHMGIAFNVPTLALFGSTCPYTDTTRDNARVLIHKMECSPCRRNPTCNSEYTCMKYITIEEVMRNVREVMV